MRTHGTTPGTTSGADGSSATDVLVDVLVSCTDVAKTYGRGAGAVVAVHGATCQVRSGDRIAIVGSSGCGKSTLLHLLAGLEEPTAGTVFATGPGGTAASASTGLVFQGPSLIPVLDVVENVALPLVLAGLDEPSAQARARSALDKVGIAALAARLPDDLSGGQAQRVAIARVLAGNPRLILADEPTGQLDATTARHVLDALVAAADNTGAALVVTTHDPTVAARLAVTWSMSAGRLHVDDPAAVRR